jgi:uncharacterized protein YjiS (DUF1127 family)
LIRSPANSPNFGSFCHAPGRLDEGLKIVPAVTSDFSGIEHYALGVLKEVEAAMNISTDGGQCGRRGGLNQVLTDWWQQLRSRHELESLDDTILRDIGLSRRKERFEQSKPFWMN